jgi:hypothetical protein
VSGWWKQRIEILRFRNVYPAKKRPSRDYRFHGVTGLDGADLRKGDFVSFTTGQTDGTLSPLAVLP